MVAKIRIVSVKAKRIRHIGRTAPRLDPAEVAARLGAEPLGIRTPRNAHPLTLLASGSEVIRRLRSRGGRPALNGTTRRQEIPLSPEDVRALERIAKSIAASHGLKPSIGQVASVILNLNIAALLKDTRGLKDPDAPQLRRIAASLAAKQK